MSYLYSEQSFGSQSVFSSSVGKAAILSLHHGIAASQEQTAVKKLKRRACSSRLAGVNADVVEHVSIERTGARVSFIAALYQKPPGNTMSTEDGKRADTSIGTSAPERASEADPCAVGVLIAVGFGKAVGFANIFRGRGNVYGSVWRWRWLWDQTAGRRNRAAAAGRINENTDVRASDALDDAFTDVRRAFLLCPRLLKRAMPSGRKHRFPVKTRNSDFPRFFPSSVAILHGNDLLLMIIRERSSYACSGAHRMNPAARTAWRLWTGWRRGRSRRRPEAGGGSTPSRAAKCAPDWRCRREETVQEPETREDQTPSYGMETFQEGIGERRRS